MGGKIRRFEFNESRDLEKKLQFWHVGLWLYVRRGSGGEDSVGVTSNDMLIHSSPVGPSFSRPANPKLRAEAKLQIGLFPPIPAMRTVSEPRVLSYRRR